MGTSVADHNMKAQFYWERKDQSYAQYVAPVYPRIDQFPLLGYNPIPPHTFGRSVFRP
jgi:hypothetical protein